MHVRVTAWVRRFFCLVLPMVCGLSGAAWGEQGAEQGADQGQYRSKILLTPQGEWAKGAGMSVEELEQQLGNIEEAYAKSSAGRYLARHYVEHKEYDKAIAYYRTALAAEGLAAVANRQMLRELAQVYLLKQDYAAAAQSLQQALAIDLVPDVADYLLLARAQDHLGQYVDVVATLDRLRSGGAALDAAQTQQALALYYHAGAYAQCEALLRQLLELQPLEPKYWHLLASVYLQQNKKKQALDQLTLAREKQVPFSEQDVLLLAKLQAANDNPYGAAVTLEAALATGEVPASGANYRALFEFWLAAREHKKAQQALQQAAHLSGDTQLYLYLAQLQMEQQNYQGMQQTLLAACAKPLPDEYVGRANLLLGVSQLKLGDAVGARRSLINATLIGGANAEAGQWLNFMQAEPTTAAEAARIVGVCYGAHDRRLSGAASAATPAEAPSPSAPQPQPATDTAAFEIKTVPPMRLFYLQYQTPLTQLVESLHAKVISLNVALIKSGGSVDGPLQIIFHGDSAAPQANLRLQLALPFRGSTAGSGKFRVQTTQTFKCVSRPFAGAGEELRPALTQLAVAAQAANQVLTGEVRMVIAHNGTEELPQLELQLGIR